MKKRNLKSLKLNKKSISNLTSGATPAQTCEGPCKGGTGCCEGGEPHTMQLDPVCTFDPASISWRIGVCDCILI